MPRTPTPTRTMPRPPQGAIAAAMEELDAQAAAAQITARASRVEQMKAAALGTTPSKWMEIPPDLRATIEALAGPSLEGVMGDPDLLADAARPTTIDPDLFEAVRHSREDASVTAQLHDQDEKEHVWLWDRPQGGMHWGRSRFHVTQMAYAIREKGFSPQPYMPVAPDPMLTCDYVSPQGVRCEKLLRTAQEVADHQLAKHGPWRRQRDAERAREREENLIALQRQQLAQTAILLRQAGLTGDADTSPPATERKDSSDG